MYLYGWRKVEVCTPVWQGIIVGQISKSWLLAHNPWNVVICMKEHADNNPCFFVFSFHGIFYWGQGQKMQAAFKMSKSFWVFEGMLLTAQDPETHNAPYSMSHRGFTVLLYAAFLAGFCWDSTAASLISLVGGSKSLAYVCIWGNTTLVHRKIKYIAQTTVLEKCLFLYSFIHLLIFTLQGVQPVSLVTG